LVETFSGRSLSLLILAAVRFSTLDVARAAFAWGTDGKNIAQMTKKRLKIVSSHVGNESLAVI
jgi:hypothetical protein